MCNDCRWLRLEAGFFSDLPDEFWLWLARGAGAIAGSAISIAYLLPGGRREAVLRLLTGVVTGMVFGSAAGLKIADLLGVLDRVSAFETTLMGATAASLCAWWALGIMARFASRYDISMPRSGSRNGGDKEA